MRREPRPSAAVEADAAVPMSVVRSGWIVHDDGHMVRVLTKIRGQGVLGGRPGTSPGSGAYVDKS
jgi:hypothetical protein